ncbi:MAG: hypothetical protein R2857_04620 [Vampirovibrionales bacterium]
MVGAGRCPAQRPVAAYSSRQSHHHLLIDHQAGHSTSNQLYKSIVLDEARRRI